MPLFALRAGVHSSALVGIKSQVGIICVRPRGGNCQPGGDAGVGAQGPLRLLPFRGRRRRADGPGDRARAL